MSAVALYFKVHQPYLLDLIGSASTNLFPNSYSLQQKQLDRVAEECYLPCNELLLQLIHEYRGNFKFSISISGTIIELLQRFRPDVIESFQRLVNTGCVEMMGETYYHSLSSLHSVSEWKSQVRLHSELIEAVFGVRPSVYRNTELIHNNKIAELVQSLGFNAVLCEGVEKILGSRSANRVYKLPGTQFPLLLRNAQLSDDIAFRFGDVNWTESPLTAEKFAKWLNNHPEGNEVFNLFMDYETFGIHKTKESGIFDFLQQLPEQILSYQSLYFSLPSIVAEQMKAVDEYDSSRTISWEDRGDAACVWSENAMQHNMLRKIYSLEATVLQSNCDEIIAKWRQLQAADYFYYMTNENEKYRNPYESEQKAGQQYQRIVNEFEVALIQRNLQKIKKTTKIKLPALSIF